MPPPTGRQLHLGFSDHFLGDQPRSLPAKKGDPDSHLPPQLPRMERLGLSIYFLLLSPSISGLLAALVIVQGDLPTCPSCFACRSDSGTGASLAVMG